MVKSAKAFVEAADADTRSKNIQPGFYRLRKQMSAESALAMLLDPKNKIANGRDHPRGPDRAQHVQEAVRGRPSIPVTDFQAAAKDPEALGIPDFWFKRATARR